MEPLTLLETIEWAQDPLATCAGAAVITRGVFIYLAKDIVGFPEVTKTEEEILVIFEEQSKRFTGCGANNIDDYAVLRRNPESGWKYIIDLVTANE